MTVTEGHRHPRLSRGFSYSAQASTNGEGAASTAWLFTMRRPALVPATMARERIMPVRRWRVLVAMMVFVHPYIRKGRRFVTQNLSKL